jgi:hypothetical protein
MKVEGDDVLEKSQKEEEREKVIERIFQVKSPLSSSKTLHQYTLASRSSIYDLPNKIVLISDNKQLNNK